MKRSLSSGSGARRALKRSKAAKGAPAFTSASAVRWQRLQQSGLLAPRPAGDDLALNAAHIATSLCGIQAQDLSAALLALWQRLPGGAASESATALTRSRCVKLLCECEGLVRVWAQRGTLQVLAAVDWPVLAAAVGERQLQRRKQVDDSRGFCPMALEQCQTTIEERLRPSEDARVTVAELDDAELRYSAFMWASYKGVGARIDSGGLSTLASRACVAPHVQWGVYTESHALRVLAERFFDAYAPATERDFRYFFGLLAARSRPTIDRLVDDGVLVPVEMPADGQDSEHFPSLQHFVRSNVVVGGSRSRSRSCPHVRLLGRFDPLLLAHFDKSCWIDPSIKQRVWTKNADVKACVLIDGRIRGTWKYQRCSPRFISIAVTLFPETAPLTSQERDALERQARAISKFLETTLQEIVYDNE